MVDVARDDLISLRQVAKKFGVSTQTVSAWRRRGLAARKVGRTWYTTPEALNAFSSSCTQIEEASAGVDREAHAEAMAELRTRFGGR